VDDLILAALQDRLSAAEAARLDVWRRASPANDARFRELARVWRLADRADPLLPSTPPPTLDALLARRLPSHTLPAGTPGLARRRRALIAAIGTLAAAAALAVVVLRMPDATRRPAVTRLSAAEFVTDAAEMATTRLDDGSVVRLAPMSRLRVTPVEGRREVWLDGEAYFAVARDESRPFRVHTRAGSVEVLGTRFDLRVEASELRLIVTEGAVALTAGGRRVPVGAGEMAVVAADGIPTVAPARDAQALLAWTRGFLVFQDTPLRQAARELETRYGVRVLLPDSALAARTVTAWFTHQELEQVLDALCRAVQAHCTLRDGVASIEP
jgi:transmembrane sensor